ncbi:golgi-associated PDZ and coiled-coil motif protein-containing protein [Trichinella spiralis]|uniref:golgi-associated PDZ and coiled-coil motif protein-containing protein n=1 Tax=Trichinella spiralis TaxID=6334 RepID=UPI0001EFD54E|nr:golgi-associated PDZ and coiled-coil motif protein-containing protein [Trichinella spiralis]
MARPTDALTGDQAQQGVCFYASLEQVEKQFDRAFVDLDLLLGQVDIEQLELTLHGRRKLTILSAAFARLIHKCQSLFHANQSYQKLRTDCCVCTFCLLCCFETLAYFNFDNSMHRTFAKFTSNITDAGYIYSIKVFLLMISHCCLIWTQNILLLSISIPIIKYQSVFHISIMNFSKDGPVSFSLRELVRFYQN